MSVIQSPVSISFWSVSNLVSIVVNTRYIETVGGAPGTVGVAGEEIVLGLRHRVHRHRLPPQPGLHHLLGRRRVQASQVRLKIFCYSKKYLRSCSTWADMSVLSTSVLRTTVSERL